MVLQVAGSHPDADRATPAGPRQGRPGGVRGLWGHLRVAEELRDDAWAVSTNTVAASMARQGLSARPKRRTRRKLRRPEAASAVPPDRLARDFTAAAPNQKWAGDFKQVPTGEGPVHLAAVEDLYSRRIVGFALSDTPPTARLASDAIPHLHHEGVATTD